MERLHEICRAFEFLEGFYKSYSPTPVSPTMSNLVLLKGDAGESPAWWSRVTKTLACCDIGFIYLGSGLGRGHMNMTKSRCLGHEYMGVCAIIP